MDRRTKPITEKYALDYYLRSRPTRLWTTRWNVTAAVLAVALVAGIYAFERDAAFQAAPVAAAHSSFGHRCELCHDQRGQTALRLVSLNDAHHSVSDAACQSCHRAAEHLTELVPGPSCVVCHQEHRPEQSLTQVPDSNCTDCHRQLQLDSEQAVNFVAAIESFASGQRGHPEFALLRTSAVDVGPRHGAHDVAVFDTAGGNAGQWRDRSGLKFNHKLHLDPAGAMHPDGKKRSLACSACHVPDASGQYMQPIEYESHCAACHPLRLAGPMGQFGELPHSSVEEVRGALRERVTRLRQQVADAAKPRSRQAATPRRLPLLPVPAVVSEADEQRVHRLMLDADHAVFGPEAKGMCRHCHQVEARDGQWHVSTTSIDVTASPNVATHKMVPDRWLRHARFDHQSHRAIQCRECHAATESSATADILLPSISVCRSCHGSENDAASRVRADCVLCHDYHDDSHHEQGASLEALLAEPPADSEGMNSP
jgi:hypothetical protein